MNVTAAQVQKWESGKEVPPGNLRGKLNRVTSVYFRTQEE
jgi:DNA-binding transcriptional regulator YiaG